jgi:carbonic anhydrase
MSDTLKQVLAANGRYAGAFGDKGRLALPPARRFAILTCMDARLDPAKYAGLAEGDAHVIRNAGGRASDDAIRSLVISYKLLATREWFVVHHTNCGMQLFNDEVIGGLLEQSLETAELHGDHWHDARRGPGSIEGRYVKWLAFDDLEASVVEDVTRIRAHPLVPARIPIYGFIYDVGTGRLVDVPEATTAGRAARGGPRGGAPRATPRALRRRRRSACGSGGQAQAAIADDHVATHEAVGDQEGDRLSDVVGLSDPTDRCLAGIVSEHGLPLLGRQEVPPGCIHDARRHAVHPQGTKLCGENRHEHGHGGVRGTDTSRPRHGRVRADGGNESDAAVLAEEGKSRLSNSEVRVDLLLKALADIGDADRRERAESLAAAESQNEMVERADPGECIVQRMGGGRVHDDGFGAGHRLAYVVEALRATTCNGYLQTRRQQLARGRQADS